MCPRVRAPQLRRVTKCAEGAGPNQLMILSELNAAVVVDSTDRVIIDAADRPGALDSAGVEQVGLQDAAAWRLL